MNNIYYIYLISAFSTLAIAIYTFITARNITKNHKYKYLVVILVGVFVFTAVILNLYYDEIFQKKNKSIAELITKNNKTLIDTNKEIDNLNLQELEILRQETEMRIDSLKKENELLLQYKKDIEKIEKIVGTKPETKSEIKRKLNNNTEELDNIIGYNKRLDKSILEKRKGITYSGNTNMFTFDCPKDYNSDILELSLKFIDENIVNDIAYMTISFSEQKDPTHYLYISEEIFEPQKGTNFFRVKNFFKNNRNKKIEMSVGYTLKTESKKEYPRVEKIVCKNY
ncbi:hypothetical protein KSK37_13425 [Kaistella sp. DKR-2]|uniref:hypothetical protein n=1 Tax=Kaistella soli TaxID=2849654 RepID=UPI001C2610D4|nr:hypothetical protein [Kaistella soli]MBU8884089.1 hypothetical protein [Kaistella soli]